MKKELGKLPKVFKEKWVAALRSGEFKQGRGKLCNMTDNTFCCLGVACIVAGIGPKGINGYTIAKTAKYRKVPDLIKGKQTAGSFKNVNLVSKLVYMNDGECGIRKKGFKGIATWIEKNL